MYEDHLRTCDYCQRAGRTSSAAYGQTHHKPTIYVKSASSYYREKKLAELGAVIKGVSYPGISYVGVKKTNATKTKSASNVEKSQKLKELGKLVRGNYF
jgi:hypothetical protein